MKKTWLMLAGLALAAASGAPAHARDEPRASVRVSYADLDLSRKGDVTSLKIRVRDAIDAVCGYRWQDSGSAPPGVMLCRRETRALVAPRVWAAIASGTNKLAVREIAVARR